MLAVSALRDARNEEKQQGEMEGGFAFPEVGDASLLDSIDFDDLFIGIDVLPDLEMDSEILAEFSDDYSELNAALSSEEDKPSEGEDKVSASESSGEIEIERKREAGKGGRKGSSGNQGKRKVKVDWTADLHRRFVQAVEQLGMDKAVPSRILEIMGIHCLTRHNIASHLQKYRSHRKHLLAREAEAATWSQRRHIYGAAKREVPLLSPPWPPTPTMGFPPPQPPAQAPAQARPLLHVWGHPTVDRNLMHLWPPKPSYWHQPAAPTPATPFFPHPLPAPSPRLMATQAPPLPGVPPPHGFHAHSPPPPPVGPAPHPFFDFLPTKESIDAAIGDVISKPWLPLPLGLKPPSTDSVMTELQRQGVPKVPPSCA